MDVKGIFLSWIVVADMDAAVKFYTEVVGLTLHELSEEFGWAELSGPDGCRLGLAQENAEFHMKAGTNAVVTITVENLDAAMKELSEKGAQLIGDVCEVPGEVKMQSILDKDGNALQIVEMLR